jgi:3-deoxy-D-manno-octulosonic-acid transferase
MGPAYRAAARVLHRLPYPRGTLATSLAGRRAAAARWRAWAAGARGDDPLIWAHAASVGESLALQSVVARLRARERHLRVVLTHTSPSVTVHPAFRDFDRTDYLPLDEPGPVAAVLDALRPALLLFSRGDLWPELVAGAAARRIPVAVAGGMVRPRSGRLRAPALWALRPSAGGAWACRPIASRSRAIRGTTRWPNAPPISGPRPAGGAAHGEQR